LTCSEDIDAVFVMVKPNGGSQHPSVKPLLFACLRISPNHPSSSAPSGQPSKFSITGASALDARATATQPEESDAGIQDALVMLRLNGVSTYSAKLPGHSINSSNGGKVCVGCSLTRSTMLCVLESIRRRILLSSAENERVSEPR
jgi:hypothetical protein